MRHARLALLIAAALTSGCPAPSVAPGAEDAVSGAGTLRIKVKGKTFTVRIGGATRDGAVAVMVGGQIYPLGPNGELVLPESAVKAATAAGGFFVLAPGAAPTRVTLAAGQALIDLTPARQVALAAAVPAVGGEIAAPDRSLVVTLPVGLLTGAQTPVALSAYVPVIGPATRTKFANDRAALLAATGGRTGAACDQPLPCEPITEALGLLITVDGPLVPGTLRASYDLGLLARGGDAAHARAATRILQTFRAIEADGDPGGLRGLLAERWGVRLTGERLDFTVTLGDAAVRQGAAQVEVDGVALLGAVLEVTVVSALTSGGLAPAASQPGLPQHDGAPAGDAPIVDATGGLVSRTRGEGGGLVSDAAGALVSRTRFIGHALTPFQPPAGPATNDAKYRLAAAMPAGPAAYPEYPWPSAQARLVGLDGTALSGWVTADPNGRFELAVAAGAPRAIRVEVKAGPYELITLIAGQVRSAADDAVEHYVNAASTSMAGWAEQQLAAGAFKPAELDLDGLDQDIAQLQGLLTAAEAQAAVQGGYTASLATLAEAVAAHMPPLAPRSLAKVVDTIAGGSWGYADGTGTAARFGSLQALAFDPAGDLVVSDYVNSRVRKVTPAGVVTTLAGSGTKAMLDGPAATAAFNNPWGITADNAGNVYVSEHANQRIRKIDPAGNVTTLAGTGAPGLADGPGATATFFQPTGLAVDGAGSLIVGDFLNHRVRKIAADGTVTTLAGSGPSGIDQGGFADGPGATARFNSPICPAVAPNGRVFVAERDGQRIRAIDPAGNVTTYAGTGVKGYKDGPAAQAQFDTPHGLALDGAGNLLVADQGNQRIRLISPGGIVTTIAGVGTSGDGDGSAWSAGFRGPTGIAIAANGDIWIADAYNARIRRIKAKTP